MEFVPLLGLCENHKNELLAILYIDRLSEFQTSSDARHSRCDVRGCNNLAEVWIRETLTLAQPHSFLKKLEATGASARSEKTSTGRKRGKKAGKPEFTHAEGQVIRSWFQKGWLVESRVEFWHQDVVNIQKASSNPVQNVDFDALAVKLKMLLEHERLEFAKCE